MSYSVTTRVIVALDPAHESVKSLGDMRSMYAISQSILANSNGAALIRCGYTQVKDEYYVELFNEGVAYENPEALLTSEEQNTHGVEKIVVHNA